MECRGIQWAGRKKKKQLKKDIVTPTQSNVIENASQQGSVQPKEGATKSPKNFAEVIPEGFNGTVILSVYMKLNGVAYHRVAAPLHHLERNYPDKYFVVHVDDLDMAIATYEDMLMYVDVAYITRTISQYRKQQSMVDMLHKNGVAVIVDNDDYWNIGPTHIMHKMWSKDHLYDRKGNMLSDGNSLTKWKASLMAADAVITTNSQLMEKTLKFNENVYVVPNALDSSDRQMNVLKTPEAANKVVFGYLGSPTHKRDVSVLGYAFNRLYNSDLKDRFSVVLGGDMRNTQENIEAGGKTLGSLTFESYVKTFNGDSKSEHSNFSTYPYSPVTTYMQFYNFINVSLVPLERSEFNMYKSELKMIEAAAMGCLCVCSNTLPYSEFYGDDFAVFVDDGYKGHKQWDKVLRDIVERPEDYFAKVVKAREWYLENRTLDVVNEKRKQVIDSLV